MLGIDLGTTTGKLTLALGGVAGVFGVYLVARQQSKNVRSMNKKKLLRIFDEVGAELQKTVMEVGQQEKQIRSNAAQMGQKIPEMDLYNHNMKTLTDSMAVKEAKIHAKYNVTEAQCQKAAAKYAKDEVLVRSIAKLQKLMNLFQPPKSASLPDFLTEDKMIEIMSEMMGKMNQMVGAYVGQLEAKGVTQDAAPDRFQQMVAMQMRQLQQMTTTFVHDKYKIDQAIMSAALNKYMESSKFPAAMSQLSVEQSEAFAALGIKMQ